ncbi:outer membrane protein assembly factor [Mucilaginibacter sp. HMF5004]|uniref:BamA/TamA family outer membrane protein n=1 Tax=Mucilaginibacter rivuli TaxID=2857527 RepID=UPI001C5E2F9E|nr:BamA/TamA family outer membrane protein [Mucilaginibacter rivuli]MBW4889540.1 outer membrane protein assembly factor [Mucilaginibacter rivuli]
MRICTSLLCMFLLHHCAFAQQTPPDSTQRDVIDVLHGIFDKVKDPNERVKPHKVYVSIIPTLGYTLSTGFAAGLSSVTTFYTQPDHSLNTSVINAQAFFDSNNQKTLFAQANIWADHDNYKFVSDFRITKYPDVTYGLGNEAKLAEDITYNYLRLYQTFLRRIDGNFYVGIGYNFDYHYEITNYRTKPKVRTNYEKYAGAVVPSTSTSSGYNFDFLYDSRHNPVNALGGMYVNLIFRNNYKFLRSDVDYTSAVFDIRKYFKLSKNSNNVLAIWSYDWMVLSGKPPYLDLPSTGADMYNNTGRGYTIDRFRGNNMIYLEAEYRFGITRNGLLGAVIFGNAANYSKNITDDLQNILPAGGGGLRIKINKHSNTNLCIDYGFGTQGSRGFFVNLGEVF